MYDFNRIYNEDSYKAIKQLPKGCIDLIVTDPPYEIETEGGNTSIGQSFKPMAEDLKVLNIIKGIDESILDEFIRVMDRPNIYIWCNKKQIMQYLNYFVGKHGCSFEIMTWIKTNPTPLCGGNYLIDKEFCLYFRKGIKLNTTFETAATYWITPKNKEDRDNFLHPTIKPLNIIEKLISNSSNKGEIVADFFLGSGTTCVAAKKLGRQYIGFEINKEIFDIAQDRLNGINVSERKIIDAGQISLF